MRTPRETIDYVEGILKQKQEKGLKCFYTIKVYKNDATNELVSRKPASPEFSNDVQNIIDKNKPDAVIIELYRGKSAKVKDPESVFDINLVGRDIVFPARVETVSGFDQSVMITEMRRNLDQQIQSAREFAGLTASLTITQMELRHSQERVKELEKELKEAETYIDGIEKDLRSRPSLNGPAGLNIIEIGSYMLEGVLRRNPSLIAGISGMNEQQVKGLFSNQQKELSEPKEGNAKASVTMQGEGEQLTEREQMRVQIIEQIAGFLRKLPDNHLRSVYELMFAIGKDLSLLDKFKTVANDQPTDEKNEEPNA